MRSNWLYSGPLDLIFVLPAVWLVPVSLLLFSVSNDFGKFLIIAMTAALSVAHLVSPLALYMAKPRIRSHVKSQRRFAALEVILSFFTPLVVMLIAWRTMASNPGTSLPLLQILATTGLIYHLFNSHHFTMQHFGIARLYLPPQGLPDIRLIKSAVWIVSFIVPIGIWSFSNMRISYFTYFATPPEMPKYLPSVSMMIVGAVFLSLTVRAFRRRYLTFQLGVSYFSFCMISFLICVSPLFFTLLLSSTVHWIQTVYLTSYQLGISDPAPLRPSPGRANSALWVFTAIALISFSCAIYATGHAAFAGKSTISIFGDIIGPLERLEFSSFLVIGVILGVAFTHFYLERFIYRRNPYLKHLQNGETT